MLGPKNLLFISFMCVTLALLNIYILAPRIEQDIEKRVINIVSTDSGSTNLSISVNGRDVQISGEVGSSSDRDLLQSKVKSVLGVRRVISSVTVKEQSLDFRSQTHELGETESEVFRIYFYFNTNKLKPGCEGQLADLINHLKSNPDKSYQITGHTDSTGDQKLNLKLSELRAKFVYERAIKDGVDPNRLSYKGLGDRMPLFSNDSKLGRKQNRRIELSAIRMEPNGIPNI